MDRLFFLFQSVGVRWHARACCTGEEKMEPSKKVFLITEGGGKEAWGELGAGADPIGMTLIKTNYKAHDCVGEFGSHRMGETAAFERLPPSFPLQIINCRYP
ncbi:hypothetical protein RR46_04681 [Papilio xuthus]|uniref:Uncharacterized protein n=1 Tax=Papilio xuthus TaxID=66420 RepID=A0A194Q083_PAPXU|nr:hypothetical protein RR46_04681 [Papilio xuthus]